MLANGPLRPLGTSPNLGEEGGCGFTMCARPWVGKWLWAYYTCSPLGKKGDVYVYYAPSPLGRKGELHHITICCLSCRNEAVIVLSRPPHQA